MAGRYDKMTAAEWGDRHHSCGDAMEQRRALGSDATQADWYRVCDRGDWLLWQLEHHSRWPELREVVQPVIDEIVARAIRRGVKSLRVVRSPEATAYRRWARRWLSGEDRSGAAAWTAAEAAAETAAWTAAKAAAEAAAETAGWDAAMDAELRRQARDIHSVIPEWPNEEADKEDSHGNL